MIIRIIIPGKWFSGVFFRELKIKGLSYFLQSSFQVKFIFTVENKHSGTMAGNLLCQMQDRED